MLKVLVLDDPGAAGWMSGAKEDIYALMREIGARAAPPCCSFPTIFRS